MSDDPPLYLELAEAPEGGRAVWLTSGRRRIRAAIWPGGTRGTVLIFTGRSEYIEKYGEVITALRARGFSVATLDWRGQGLSDRALDDPMRGHVGDFAAYQRDIDALLAWPEVAASPGPRILLCHSMGGCIGLRALLDERVEPVAAIFSAPMFGIAASPPMRIATALIIALAARFGFETRHAPVPKAGQAYVLYEPFETNSLTGDSDRYALLRKHLEAEPGFALGAPTLRWLRQAFEEIEALADAPAAETPSLIFLGDEETVVEPAAIRAYDAKAPSCRLVELVGARHEVLLETPAIRREIWDEIDRFLADLGV